MKQLSRNIPDGMRDIIFDEALLYENIQEKFSDIYQKNGFRKIITPVIEYYDVFDYEGQSIHQENMYKFTDNSGRLAVLRADNTTPIARIAATKLKNYNIPMKIYYNQNVYRINSGYSGKRNEIMQSGVEIIGTDGVRSELICIITALEALKNLGLEVKLEIGHVGFYNALIEELGLPNEKNKIIRKYVNSKNAVSLENAILTEDINNLEKLNKIKRLPLLFGGAEVLDEATMLAGDNAAALEALRYTENLYNMLIAAGYKDMVMIDLGIVHEIDYYTGTVFRGYVQGAGEPVLGGGRYNNLICNFDYDLPATGFAINVCLVAEAYTKTFGTIGYKASEYVIYFDDEMFNHAEKMKSEFELRGKKSEYSSFATPAETIEWAKNNNVRFAVIIQKKETKIIDVTKV